MTEGGVPSTSTHKRRPKCSVPQRDHSGNTVFEPPRGKHVMDACVVVNYTTLDGSERQHLEECKLDLEPPLRSIYSCAIYRSKFGPFSRSLRCFDESRPIVPCITLTIYKEFLGRDRHPAIFSCRFQPEIFDLGLGWGHLGLATVSECAPFLLTAGKKPINCAST